MFTTTLLFFVVVTVLGVRCESNQEEELKNMYKDSTRMAFLLKFIEFVDHFLPKNTIQKNSFEEIGGIFESYDEKHNTSFSGFIFALTKLMWHNRNDNQVDIPKGTCDRLLAEYETWETIDGAVTRRLIDECLTDRLLLEYLRNNVKGLEWLPQDLLTNPFRKYVFGVDLLRSALVYWQYMRDHAVDIKIIHSGEYTNNWKAMGLVVLHYDGVNTQEEWDTFRQTHTLDDYMFINRVNQRVAIEWLINTAKEIVNSTFEPDDVRGVLESIATLFKVLGKLNTSRKL
jgi:hypothetical protein